MRRVKVNRRAVDKLARRPHPAGNPSYERARATTVVDMPPFFFADVGELYRIADQISRHADAARCAASRLAAAVAHDRWRGIASDVFSAEATSVLRDLRAAADRLDDAAEALRRQADRINGLIHQAERLCADVAQLGETVADVAGAVVEAVF